jgi:restriction system protein
MKSYYRIMPGAKSIHAEECFKGNFIGADYGIKFDLRADLTENWRDFNSKFIPIYLKDRPHKTKIAAGLACGALWTIIKGIKSGEIVLCANGRGGYYVGEVIGDYFYQPNEILFHRRNVNWLATIIDRSAMSEEFRNSCGTPGTVRDISRFAEEIEKFIAGNQLITQSTTLDEAHSVFELEKHLEDFLVKNWRQTDLGKKYDIFEEDGELVGQQYQSDTGPIDILAISKDKRQLLVVELKRGRVSDAVVGQIQRYMGYVLDELAEEHQTVHGVIIGLEDDLKIKRALKVTKNIEFYRYQVSFKLFKGEE